MAGAKRFLADFDVHHKASERRAEVAAWAEQTHRLFDKGGKFAHEADLAEVAEFLEQLGLERSKPETKQMMALVDEHEAGRVTWREFLNMVLLDEGVVDKPVTRHVNKGTLKRRQQRVRRAKRGHLMLAVSLEREAEGHELTVMIRQGKALRVVDKHNKTAQAYTKLYINPDPKKATKKKTKVAKRGLNPVWDEEFVYHIPEDANLADRKLSVSVWDDSTLRRQVFMGGMTFGLDELLDCETKTAGWFVLLDEEQSRLYNYPCREIPQPPRPVLPMTPIPPSPLAPYLTTIDNFTFLKVLGRGNYGKVLLAEETHTKEMVAVKILKKTEIFQADEVDCAMTERRVLGLCGLSPFLTRLFGAFESPASLFLVMEPLMGGDLMHMLLRNGTFPVKTITFYAAELCLALWFLHSHNVVYRDVKLDNVLLGADGHVKLVDFGMAKDGVDELNPARTFCGTPSYLAPEIVKYEPYGPPVDFWALGVLIYEALVGSPIFASENESELFELIVEGEMKFPKFLRKSTKHVLQGFLTRDPAARLCSEKAIKHQPFFKHINWNKLQMKRLKPPYVPKLEAKSDTSHFDVKHTMEKAAITPTDPDALSAIDQEAFEGFSSASSFKFAPPS